MKLKSLLGFLLVINVSVGESLPIENSAQRVLASEESIIQKENLWVIKDPIASYAGQNIVKEDILNFVESFNGSPLVEVAFSKEELHEIVTTYLLYQYLEAQAKEEGLDRESYFLEKKEIEDNFLLANAVLEQEIADFNQLDDEKPYREKSLSVKAMGDIASKLGMRVSEEQIKNNPNIQNDIRIMYASYVALANIGRSQQIDQETIFKNRLKYQTQRLIADYYIQSYLATAIPTAEELLEIYYEWLDENDHYQYKASHIYFSRESHDVASRVLAELKSGQITFMDAVQEYSIDELSRSFNGRVGHGDWVTFVDPNHPFVTALRGLKIGGYTQTIVEGVDGYHIIMLDDKSLGDIPTLKEKKEEIVYLWRSKILNQFYKNKIDELSTSLVVF